MVYNANGTSLIMCPVAHYEQAVRCGAVVHGEFSDEH